MLPPTWWTVEDEPCEAEPEFSGTAAVWVLGVRMFPGHCSRAILVLRCEEDGRVTAAIGRRRQETA